MYLFQSPSCHTATCDSKKDERYKIDFFNISLKEVPVIYYYNVEFQKLSIPTPRKPNFLKESMTLNWKFWRGEGSK